MRLGLEHMHSDIGYRFLELHLFFFFTQIYLFERHSNREGEK